MKNSNKNVVKSAAYWTARVNKLVVGRSVKVPGYATVTCHAKATPTRSRRFKITDVERGVKACGNLALAAVVRGIKNVAR